MNSSGLTLEALRPAGRDNKRNDTLETATHDLFGRTSDHLGATLVCQAKLRGKRPQRRRKRMGRLLLKLTDCGEDEGCLGFRRREVGGDRVRGGEVVVSDGWASGGESSGFLCSSQFGKRFDPSGSVKSEYGTNVECKSVHSGSRLEGGSSTSSKNSALGSETKTNSYREGPHISA